MKRVALVPVLSFVLLCLTVPSLTVADTEGTSAKGNFQISLGNGQSREIRFDARVGGDGSTTGEITFRDEGTAVIGPRETQEDEPQEDLPLFYAKVSCDCLIVSGVEAALSGTIMESSRKNYIGQRALLVVQDGDSLTPPLRDKLTFGFYKTASKGWPVTDGDRPDEQTQAPTWVATDLERPDDTGTLSQQSEEVTCKSVPISSHSFIGSKQGKGIIQVTR